ncbi:MAG: glycoside hydrolase family 15 protein [Chloroflexi bacterium AL-W]|nr:glycoside hydrolase family 15 protein [Chloroflexi bacterium AL-N1]NOK66460.1 glycoside hydrolase family 15 protein [Chloroflexi bacterium AL-N10]NOK71848.1 glycoside hydrolase family 15 protein [Chloroflexi bacterium AL-N5]NOK81105.1 glycoside hydrolase family 15 protein [Chloroflexi bacterium AL-W]NOK89378.1 glycoside hydrolase family 15 protein [Chloroflexi bacterium AL-N15]
MAYQPIEDYGIIGDMHTVALIGMNGSIDWFCFPHFDSPSVFAAILDEQKGGRFKIAPLCNGVSHKQFYWPDTNILVTRFLSPDGVGELTDYMPVGEAARSSGQRQLIRRISVIRGTMEFEMECHPAFNYARDDHSVEVTEEGVSFHSDQLSMGMATNLPVQQNGHSAKARFTLSEGETAVFVLREVVRGAGCGATLNVERAEELFRQTVTYWRTWLSKCTYTGRWREMVHRSALALKLLTFEPTGAIVAAPTCALPETLGGERNWDYRYTWIRDAAFTIYGLLRIGFTEEAAKFMQWLEARSHELNDDGSLQIMYGIDGRHTLTEETLDHLEGYRGSRPVRIGNGAYNQLQLDIYGELMDSVYLYNKYGAPISYDLWTELRRLTNWLCDNWHREDEGIWEVRGGQQHFVYSKLMCWVAFDRAIRLADKRSFPSDRDRWRKVRDEIYEEIMDKGWSNERQAFVQAYGSQALDASNLMLPLVFFLSPNDPRMLKTLDATSRSLSQGGLMASGLVYRYDVNQTDDGLDGIEGTFNICTFWMVEALTRAGRTDRARLDDARFLFEHMLGYANHLGLYAEEIGPHGEALGNFPQAFTHLALISAAFNLDRALGSR